MALLKLKLGVSNLLTTDYTDFTRITLFKGIIREIRARIREISGFFPCNQWLMSNLDHACLPQAGIARI